ncbi:MAG: putative RNA uridine N3 methyltransferase, partial [Candidatus Bathyarchaeia archaeon]
MGAKRRKMELFIAVPDSLVSDIPHQRERTAAIGLVGRAVAIFRVDGIVIYKDPGSGGGEASFLRLILNYMETPQYLLR